MTGTVLTVGTVMEEEEEMEGTEATVVKSTSRVITLNVCV